MKRYNLGAWLDRPKTIMVVRGNINLSLLESSLTTINRIYHWSPLQTREIRTRGKWIMTKTRFTEFLASVDLRVGIFMPPTSKKLRGHIGLGMSVCPFVRLSNTPIVGVKTRELLELGN